MTVDAPDASIGSGMGSSAPGVGPVGAAASAEPRNATEPGTFDGQRRNIRLLGIDMAVFAMGLGALGQLTVIPLFVSKLTDNPLAIGAVAAAIQIGWLPQILVAGPVERSARKWPWVTRYSFLERFPTLVLAAPSATWLVLAFVLLGVVQSGSLLARLSGPIEYAPPERRPSYVALAFGIFGPCSAVAPLVGGQIVAALGYGWLFGVSALIGLLAVPVLGRGARPPARSVR